MVATASRLRKIKARRKRIEFEASRSLEQYLGNMVIDCRPEPKRWADVWEPWQGDIIRPMIAPIERICGIRKKYEGPNYFMYVLPKGHDKTGLIGRICTFAIRFSKRKIRVASSASTRDQAGLLRQSMADEIELNPWLQGIYTYKKEIRGPGGALEVLSGEAGASSGRKDDIVIMDELTFMEDRDLYDMLFGGVAKRPGSVFIIICNAGLKNTWQWDIRAQAIKSDNWYFYESPRNVQLASWMDETAIEEIRATISPQFARRVIGNEWITATERPMLSEKMIRGAMLPGLLW